MAEALGLTGSVSCLVKNKKEISLLLEKNTIFLEKKMILI